MSSRNRESGSLQAASASSRRHPTPLVTGRKLWYPASPCHQAAGQPGANITVTSVSAAATPAPVRVALLRKMGRPRFGLAITTGNSHGSAAAAISNGDHWTITTDDQNGYESRISRRFSPLRTMAKVSNPALIPANRPPASGGASQENGSAKSEAVRG